MTQENVDEIRALFCKNCETKELYHLSIETIKGMLKQAEEMAFLLYEKSESVGERKWWKQEWQTAVERMKKFKLPIPGREVEE